MSEEGEESKMIQRRWPVYLTWKSQEERQDGQDRGQFKICFDHIKFEVYIEHLGRECWGNLKIYLWD